MREGGINPPPMSHPVLTERRVWWICVYSVYGVGEGEEGGGEVEEKFGGKDNT